MFRLNDQLIAVLRPIVAPVAILLVAVLALALGATLPPSLAGLKTLGPYGLLVAAAAVCAWFNRGRALIAAMSLLAAYAGYRLALEYGDSGFAARAAYVSLVILVPANVLAALALPERGVIHHGAWRWLVLLAIETLLVAWFAAAGQSPVSGAAWPAMLDHWLLRAPPTPWAGRILFGAAFAAAVARAWPEQTPLEIGIAGMLAAFFVACEWVEFAGVFGVFVSAAGAMLIVALLQESYRLAFRDALTGLPGRRALEERMSALGPRYAMAMVDVDHFKKFNDTHGHDVGDQVLKLVAARLATVSGGGRAFRYGGEEFTVLFTDCGPKAALPHVEAVRKAIENYKMDMRGDDRPKDEKQGSEKRGARTGEKTLSVTVSIGVAGPGEDAATPALVLKAADQALYRAKQGGRNRVST